MTPSESSSPTPEPEREPSQPTQPGPPPDVLDRILSALLEAVEGCRGDLESVDIDAVAEDFPGFRGAVHQEWNALLQRSRNAKMIGPYRRVREIGRGGMGTVWEAFDPRLKRSVAIKQLDIPRDLGLSRGSRGGERIEREAEALASLNHPNVVMVYGLDQIDGMACLVMELVRGASLDRILRVCRSGAALGSGSSREYVLSHVLDVAMGAATADDWPTVSRGAGVTETRQPADRVLRGSYLRDVCRAMAGAAEGLAYAHRLGLVHRDIKPGNLIMDRDRTIKIADFGLAKGSGLAQLSVTGQFIGTFQYASPEQASMRHEVGAPSDVWSLGVTLYELVTLALPFRDERGEDVLRAIRSQKPPRPRQLNPRIPADLDRLIWRCLEKDPALRPTAEKLAIHLREFAEGEYVSLGSVPPHRRLLSLLRRPTRWSTAAMLAVLAIATVLSIAAWQKRRARDLRIRDAIEEARDDLGLVEKNKDPADFRRALDAVHRLKGTSSEAAVQAEVARITGRLAAARGSMAKAARLLAAAGRLRPLVPEDKVLLARATLAAGEVERAWELYEDLAAEEKALLLPREMKLAHAFAQSSCVELSLSSIIEAPSMASGGRAPGPVRLEEALPVGKAGGRPADVFVCRPRGDEYWNLFTLRPSDSDLEVRPLSPPRDADGVRVYDIASGPMGPEGDLGVVAACNGSVYVAWGDLGGPDAPDWRMIEEPEPHWHVDPDVEQKRTNLRAAILPGTSRLSAPAPLAVAWYRCGRTVPQSPGAPSLRWPFALQGSDVEFLEPVTWKEKPLLLLGLGPWKHFSLHLLEPSRGGRLIVRSSVTMGTPCDAKVLHRADGDLLVVSTKAQEMYINDLLFGRSSPYGWEHGVYLMDEDEATGSLVTLARSRFPRPPASLLHVWTADLLGGEEEEVLCAEMAEQVRRTRVFTIVGKGRATRFGPGLWLPGAICGVARNGPNEDVLVTEELRSGKLPLVRVVRVPR